MSTNIYYGLRALQSDPFKIAQSVREALEPKFFESFKNFYVLAKSAPENTKWSDLFYVKDKDRVIRKHVEDFDLHEIISEFFRTAVYTFSELDIGYEVALYPNSAGGNPLLLVSGEKAREFIEILKDSNVVEEYGYWNGPDPEEDISDEEWGERKLAWSNFIDSEQTSNALTIMFPSSLESSVNLFANQKN